MNNQKKKLFLFWQLRNSKKENKSETHKFKSLRLKKKKENTKLRSRVTVHTVNAESHFFAPLLLMVFSGKFYIPQKLVSLIYSFPRIHYLVSVKVPVLLFSKFRTDLEH